MSAAAELTTATSTPAAVREILSRANTAAAALRASSPLDRQRWINAVAETLLAHQEELAVLGDEETHLGLPRLRGELAGAANSARFYATVAVDGHYLSASTEKVSDTVTLSRWNTPVGPVAVFGASNFPFGFGVFGHDVASAIAAGCPVVVKAHPAHPLLSIRLAELATAALSEAGAPEGTYGLVVGFEAGLQLVDAAEITSIAFTGSQRAGMAIRDRAAARGVPVFAEMGTVNPAVVTPAAAATPDRQQAIAAGFVASFTLGAGQFCTKPGLIFVPAGAAMLTAIEAETARVAPAQLLTTDIAAHFVRGVQELAEAANVPSAESSNTSLATAQVISVTLADLVAGSRLLDECFGPVALVCEYDSIDQVITTLAGLQNSLAASVFTGADDDQNDATQSAAVVALLLTKTGRVALNAWPTGVSNTWSQQHGGPWPATSRPEATSVGAGALSRFVRPVAIQNASPALLPPFLAGDNPWNIPRRINGTYTPAQSAQPTQPAEK